MSVRRYAIKRILLTIPILFGVSVITFALVKLLPGDAITYLLQFSDTDPETVRQIRAKYGLNKPVWEQYLIWLWNAVNLDFGQSLITDRTIESMIGERLPETVVLGLFGFLIAVCIGVPAGVVAAVRKGETTDEVSRIFALLGIATPNFWLGLMLLLVFGVWTNTFSVIPPTDKPLWSPAMVTFMLLPAITLGTASAALLMRLTRSSMLEEINKDYVRMARAKGLPERTVILKHVFRNSLISVVTVSALQIAFLVDGAVVVEQVFSWPGLGRLVIRAINQRDVFLLQAAVLMIGTTIVFANLVADLIYSYLDPRIRY